jgi:hypothetical protein
MQTNLDIQLMHQLHSFLKKREKTLGLKIDHIAFIELAVREKMERYFPDRRRK